MAPNEPPRRSPTAPRRPASPGDDQGSSTARIRRSSPYLLLFIQGCPRGIVRGDRSAALAPAVPRQGGIGHLERKTKPCVVSGEARVSTAGRAGRKRKGFPPASYRVDSGRRHARGV